MISKGQLKLKRIFDLCFSLILLPFLIFPIAIAIFLASLETKRFGIFTQKRIGQYGKPFCIYKIRTLKLNNKKNKDKHENVGVFGRLFRKSKLDELPQLWNIIIGDMSFVGPRPDLPGFADVLKGEDRIILEVKPGLTGPASIKYKNEESLLAKCKNAEDYNTRVIWPDKVKINKQYVLNWSFSLDLKIIVNSLLNG